MKSTMLIVGLMNFVVGMLIDKPIGYLLCGIGVGFVFASATPNNNQNK